MEHRTDKVNYYLDIADTVLQKRYDDNDMIVLRERDFLHR